jgi:flagellar hook-associated protein 1 FlgK
MGVGFASYEIARSGLTVNERGLYVTGHNIANVNTPGYVRQQAMIKNGPVESYYTRGGLVQLGLGADIQEVRQIRHSFLDNIYRQESTTLGYWESRQKTIQDVESIMAEPMESGLQNVLNQFWDSWQELSKDPDSITVRALVRQRSEALVQQINHMGTQLDRLQDDLNSEIGVRIDEVNDITKQIAGLNVSILKTEVCGDSANDYRDQRNSLLDRLTKLVNVDVNEMQDGQVDVTLGGYYLVQKGVSTDLYADEKETGDNYYVAKLGGTNIEVPLKSGILKGLMESRGEVSGAIGSYANGSPDTKADVVFYVDAAEMALPATAANINNAIAEYTAELTKKGIDCTGHITIQPVTSAADIVNKVTSPTVPTTLRDDANKYAVLLTGGSLTAPDLATLQAALSAKGMDTSVITNNPGDWTTLTNALDGSTYSLADFENAATLTTLAQSMAVDTNKDVSDNYSIVSDTMNIVPDIKKRLNAMLNVMLREINYIHKSGTTLKDPPTPGSDFFEAINASKPLEMGNIQLNSNLSDLSNITASKSGGTGDNANALEIANLRNKALIGDSTGILSIDDYYQSIILHMGNSGSDAVRIAESQSKLVQSADSYRTSITGVSMDEEMSNMMKYKFAYDAASRVLNVVDTMMETIVNKLGIVGR